LSYLREEKKMPDWKDDGLKVIDTGAYAIEKYQLLTFYLTLFAAGMKKKWDRRVYVDLYSGPGALLAFYSREARGLDFWDKALSGSSQQESFSFPSPS
jgi:hypothetical protein